MLTGIKPPSAGQCDTAGGAINPNAGSGAGSGMGQTTYVVPTAPTGVNSASNNYGFTPTDAAAVRPDITTNPPQTGDIWMLADGTAVGVFDVPAPALGTSLGQYAVQAAAPSAAGQLQFTAGGVALHTTDSGGTDNTLTLAQLGAGDTVYLDHPDGVVIVTLTAPPTFTSGVADIVGTSVVTGTQPGDGEDVDLSTNVPERIVATGATSGQPGSFTPAGAVPPADLAALQALGDLGQTTRWPVDSFVVLGDGSKASWDGSAWQPGPAVPPAPITGSGDITSDVSSTFGVDPATLADLAAIKADATIGDGNYAGSAFQPDQYVVLGDSSAATYDGSAWSAWLYAGWPDGDVSTQFQTATGIEPGDDLEDLPTLKADATVGDGAFPGLPFTTGQFIILGDDSSATWDGSAWAEWTAPAPAPAPDPDDEPDDDVIPLPGPSPEPGWAREDIIVWLGEHGVTLDDDALAGLSDVELLGLADDLLDTP